MTTNDAGEGQALSEVAGLAAVVREAQMVAYEDGKGGWLFRSATPVEIADAVLRSPWLAEHVRGLRGEVRRDWQPGDGDTRCQKCGTGNPAWFTDNDLWNRVMGDDGGVLCPGCFTQRANERFPDLLWCILPQSIASNRPDAWRTIIESEEA